MIRTLSPTEAAELQRAGADLIDVRTAKEFAAVHAVGARHLPLDRLDPAALLAERNGRETQALMILCHSGARAQQAAERLQAAGCTQAIVVAGGTLGWKAAGLPVSVGQSTLDVMRQVQLVIGAGIVGGAALTWFVHPYFLGIPAFFGAGLLFAGASGLCPLASLMAAMPWNRSAGPGQASCCTPRS